MYSKHVNKVLLLFFLHLLAIPSIVKANSGGWGLGLVLAYPIFALIYLTAIMIIYKIVSWYWKSAPNQKTLVWRRLFFLLVFLLLFSITLLWYVSKKEPVQSYIFLTRNGIISGSILFGILIGLILYLIIHSTKRPKEKFFNTWFFIVFVITSLITNLIISLLALNLFTIDRGLLCDAPWKQEGFRDACLWRKAVVLGEAKICEQISNQFTKPLCYGDVSQSTGDPKLCEFSNEKNTCYYETAYASGDVSICEFMSYDESRTRCYVGVLRKTREAPHCLNQPSTIEGYKKVELCYKDFLKTKG